jgi:hypothetical protein
MDEPVFSIRVEPAPGATLSYTGAEVLLRVAIDNALPVEIALPFVKMRHNGVAVKFADGADPSNFAYANRCPGCASPEEKDETLVKLAPGASVSFDRSIEPFELEQFSGPDLVDVICEFSVRTKVLVGEQWREQISKAAARIQGRRLEAQ